MIVLFAGSALMLALFGAIEIVRQSGPRLDASLRRMAALHIPWFGANRPLGELIDGLGTEARLQRAGLRHEITTARLLLIKLAAASVGLLTGIAVISLFGGGRFLTLIGIAMPFAFFLGPDAGLEALGRKRMRRIERGLSDALDLAANGIGSGEDPLQALSGSSRTMGPLGVEFGVISAERACGLTRTEILSGFEQRAPSPDVLAVSAMIQRSARFGAPLSQRFRQHAEEMRRSERRRIIEQAARSSPRIQLVVALLLVPSVLLMIAAGLLANLGSFLSGL